MSSLWHTNNRLREFSPQNSMRAKNSLTSVFESSNHTWAARKWGCNKWGLKGCLAALPGNRPKSPFFCPFSALFRRVPRAPWKSRKRRKKAFFLRYPQISLNPHLLNPHLRHFNILSKTVFGPFPRIRSENRFARISLLRS